MSELDRLRARIVVGFSAFLLLLGAATAALYATMWDPDEVVSTRRERFTVARVTDPRWPTFDLADASGATHAGLHLGKHCAASRHLAEGQAVELDVPTLRRPERRGGGTYERVGTPDGGVCPAT